MRDWLRDCKVYNPEGLEINATLHCNMRCTSCSHLSPLFRKEVVDPTELSRQLSVLSTYYHASFVKILGGEPLLHPDLLGVIRAVRDSGVADTILLCTNGTLLPRAPEALWDAVDALEISVYPSRMIDPEQIAHYQAMAARHGVELTVNYYEHFRVAYSETGTDSPALVQEIYETCKLVKVWLAHTMIDGWFYKCPQSVFLPRQVENADWDGRIDGLEITDSVEFRDRLVEFLNAPTPLRACRNCLGSVGRIHPHAEVRRDAWRQTARTEEVLDREFLELAKKDVTVDDGCVALELLPTSEAGR
ncbi:radical SAM protein [Micromonospora chersina]|uniref:radical SAM protein n=1 Tax=Micromonospora chersina TaxID=47854 RepID=UPI003C7EEAB7